MLFDKVHKTSHLKQIKVRADQSSDFQIEMSLSRPTIIFLKYNTWKNWDKVRIYVGNQRLELQDR